MVVCQSNLLLSFCKIEVKLCRFQKEIYQSVFQSAIHIDFLFKREATPNQFVLLSCSASIFIQNIIKMLAKAALIWKLKDSAVGFAEQIILLVLGHKVRILFQHISWVILRLCWKKREESGHNYNYQFDFILLRINKLNW